MLKVLLQLLKIGKKNGFPPKLSKAKKELSMKLRPLFPTHVPLAIPGEAGDSASALSFKGAFQGAELNLEGVGGGK